jgi:hypothetical protein
MKRKLFLVIMPFCALAAFCQDVIVMRNADEIEAIIQDIGISDVKYKRYSNPGGPTYTVLKSDISMIRYANGEEETFLGIAANAPTDGDFTTMQRFGTLAINSFIPGLGSFIIMKDKVGGGIQLAIGALGIGLIIGGAVTITNAYANQTLKYEKVSLGYGDLTYDSPYWEFDEHAISRGTAIIVIGSVLCVGGGIFNIVRSVMYKPPTTTVAGGFDPTNLQVVLIPGNHKIDKVSLAYTMHF